MTKMTHRHHFSAGAGGGAAPNLQTFAEDTTTGSKHVFNSRLKVEGQPAPNSSYGRLRKFSGVNAGNAGVCKTWSLANVQNA